MGIEIGVRRILLQSKENHLVGKDELSQRILRAGEPDGSLRTIADRAASGVVDESRLAHGKVLCFVVKSANTSFHALHDRTDFHAHVQSVTNAFVDCSLTHKSIINLPPLIENRDLDVTDRRNICFGEPWSS